MAVVGVVGLSVVGEEKGVVVVAAVAAAVVRGGGEGGVVIIVVLVLDVGVKGEDVVAVRVGNEEDGID